MTEQRKLGETASALKMMIATYEKKATPQNPYKATINSLTLALQCVERQREINNMALIQSHRKCVLGRDEMYSDSTLQNMSKAELINLLHVAQHNYSVLLETFDGRVKYYEKELAAMSDEIKFEE